MKVGQEIVCVLSRFSLSRKTLSKNPEVMHVVGAPAPRFMQPAEEINSLMQSVCDYWPKFCVERRGPESNWQIPWQRSRSINSLGLPHAQPLHIKVGDGPGSTGFSRVQIGGLSFINDRHHRISHAGVGAGRFELPTCGFKVHCSTLAAAFGATPRLSRAINTRLALTMGTRLN